MSEEFRAKIDGGLAQKKYLYRTVDGLSQEIGEDPAKVLSFLRTHPDDYVISIFQNNLYASLKHRVDEALRRKEEELQAAMKGTSETKEREEATLTPVSRDRILTPWAGIEADLGQAYLHIARVFRKLPPGDTKIRAGELVRWMETLEEKLTSDQKAAEEALAKEKAEGKVKKSESTSVTPAGSPYIPRREWKPGTEAASSSPLVGPTRAEDGLRFGSPPGYRGLRDTFR